MCHTLPCSPDTFPGGRTCWLRHDYSGTAPFEREIHAPGCSKALGPPLTLFFPGAGADTARTYSLDVTSTPFHAGDAFVTLHDDAVGFTVTESAAGCPATGGPVTHVSMNGDCIGGLHVFPSTAGDFPRRCKCGGMGIGTPDDTWST